MAGKSYLNIYWTCQTCGLQIAGEQPKCPNCSRQTEDSKKLSWQVEDSTSETLITVVSEYRWSTQLKRDKETGTLTVDDRKILPLSPMKVWLWGRSFEVYGWIEWKVGLTPTSRGDLVIAAGGDVRPDYLVNGFAETLARILDLQLVVSEETEWGTW